MWEDTIPVTWRTYEKVSQPVGKPTLELREVKGTAAQLRQEIIKHLVVYMRHHWEYQWLDKVRENDKLSVSTNTIYMQSDFAAQISLQGQHTPNCQFSGHCTLSCWVVVHSPRVITYTDKDGIEKTATVYECDHIRIASPATARGKDNDWFLHTTIYAHLIEYYQQLIPDLRKITLWTDGAPSQYNFSFLSRCSGRLTLVHRFAATSQFKGVHDKVGDAAKQKVRELEKGSSDGTRCSSAAEWILTVMKHLSAPVTDYKRTAEKLVSRPMLAATSYKYMYCASSIDDVTLSDAPADLHLIQLDRTKMWDCTPVPGCKSHYDFRNGISAQGHNFFMRKYPCPCPFCADDDGHDDSNRIYTRVVGKWIPHKIIEKPRTSAEVIEVAECTAQQEDAATEKAAQVRDAGAMAQGDDGEFLYCTCFTAYSQDKNMVCCDICNKWYHFECVGYTNSVPNRDFICGACPSTIIDDIRKN